MFGFCLRGKRVFACPASGRISAFDSDNLFDPSYASKIMKKPKTIYRFVALSDVGRLQQTFMESTLYLSSPSQFNDPFEFKPKSMSWDSPELDEVQKKRYVDPSLDILYRGVCEQLDNYGVCCFSKKCDDILMWSHYSEKHTGACLGFDTNNEFFKNLKKIDYQSERHDIDLRKGLASEADQRDIVLKVMLRKLRSWRYEQEWRLIEQRGKQLKPFPPEILKSVIFGAHCSEPRIRLVKALLSNRNVDFYKAEIDRYEYRLNILPCS